MTGASAGLDKTGAAYGVSEQWATLAPRHEECMFSACEESRIEHSEVEGTKSCHCSASAYATQQIILIDTSCQTKVQQLKLCMSRNFVRPQSQKNSFLSFFLPPRRPLIHVLFATSLLAFEAEAWYYHVHGMHVHGLTVKYGPQLATFRSATKNLYR